ncbi:MAG: hypothetical protein NVS4B2_33420 [Chloroflexota bacterium]
MQIALDASEADGETGGSLGLAHPLVLDRPHDAKPEIVTVCSAHGHSLAPAQQFRKLL